MGAHPPSLSTQTRSPLNNPPRLIFALAKLTTTSRGVIPIEHPTPSMTNFYENDEI